MFGPNPALPRLPVSIVTGFLGSGKTTFISGLLRRPDMAGTAVIVNEFAALGIDDLVMGVERNDGGEVVLLRNGCVCCAPTDDLTRAVLRIQQRASDVALGRPRLVIETSGLADPATLLHRLMRDLRLRLAVRLSAIVTVVDAVYGLAQLESHPVSLKQAAIADRRIVSKLDLADAAQVDAAVRRLLEINPGATTVLGQDAAQSDPCLLDTPRHDDDSGELDIARWLNRTAYLGCVNHHQNDDIRSWLVESERPIELDAFVQRTQRLMERHRDGLLRVKGMLRTLDDPAPLVIHGVQGDFHRPVRLSRWPDERRGNSIVVIGHTRIGTFAEELEEALRQAAR
jgi:G3E family GTPase